MASCENHQHCIDDALTNARQICEQAQLRLTPLREQVLQLIWQSHKPLGAYDLIDMLSKVSQKRIAPPTVYRALDFLLDIGIVHRINCLNAYIGCPSPAVEHPNYFFICTTCHSVIESDEPRIHQEVSQVADEHQFSIEKQWLEVLGQCNHCRSLKQPANTGTI